MNAPCPIGPLEALATAKAAGVSITLDGDGILLEAPDLPDDVVDLIAANKPELICILTGREAAKAALDAKPPPDCTEWRWKEARYGLKRFAEMGYGDQATLMGWTNDELYRVPELWSQIYLAGAALLIGECRVVTVAEASITIETRSGSRLKFRRIGREHVAG